MEVSLAVALAEEARDEGDEEGPIIEASGASAVVMDRELVSEGMAVKLDEAITSAVVDGAGDAGAVTGATEEEGEGDAASLSEAVSASRRRACSASCTSSSMLMPNTLTIDSGQ